DLPVGVTLRPIDGGQTYYASNGFTYAANAGMDSTMFPICIWAGGIASITDVKRAADVACNCYLAFSPGTTSSSVLSWLNSNGVYLFQGLYVDNNRNRYLSGAGVETIGFFLCDEPGYWNNSGYTDIVSSMNGTNTFHVSLKIPAHFMDNRVCHANMFHTFF